jgi:choloylglycine hydrolase
MNAELTAASKGYQGSCDQFVVGKSNAARSSANSAFRVFPRGMERTGAVAENPHRWTSKYGSLVITGYDLATHEGVNEKGLSAQILYLAGESDYGKRDPKLEGINVTQWVQYFLDNYATVAEAVEAQKTLAFQIDSLILPNGFPTLVHMSLSDKSGDSAVIEYIGGKPKVYHDKRFTVMTNEPTYDKQIENLKQYRAFGGDKPLPGERTPTDRFVRAAYYASGLPQPASRAEGAAFMFSVIRNVSVPFGKGDPDKPNVSSTIFRTVMDLTGGAISSRAPTRRTSSGSTTTRSTSARGCRRWSCRSRSGFFPSTAMCPACLSRRSRSCSA